MKRSSKKTTDQARWRTNEGFLEEYLVEFGTCAPDLLAPELQTFNTRRLNDLWKISCERADAMTAMPFWGIVWPGSRALARYILDHPEAFREQRILDIGAGSGLAGIAAAYAGARVTGMDIDPMACQLAAHTAKINHVHERCEWLIGDALQLADETLVQYDLILAGDIFYEEEFARNAMAFLRRTLKLNLKNLVADPGRTHRPQVQQLQAGADDISIQVVAEYRVPVYQDIEGIKERTTTLLTIQ